MLRGERLGAFVYLFPKMCGYSPFVPQSSLYYFVLNLLFDRGFVSCPYSGMPFVFLFGIRVSFNYSH